MTDFVIDFDWLDPLGAKGPELRATWGRLRILVNGHPVTRAYHEQSKTVRDDVYLPLYPLAEWLVADWWPLWNEPEPALPADRPGYETRHSLASAREGYALPPLRMQPTGATVLLSWSPERLQAHRMEFIGRGKFRTDTRSVRRGLSSLINAVVSRLDAHGITDTLLQQDWEAIRSADQEEREFCRYAGSLGLDPYSLDGSQQEQIREAGQRLPEEIAPEFFRAARRWELIAQAQEICDALAQARNNTANLASLKELRQAAETWPRPFGNLPWEQGYSFAEELRRRLHLDGMPLKSIKDVADAVGTTEEHLSKALTKFHSRDMPFIALMGINDKASPAFVLREALPASNLFHFCRALFEYLCSPTLRSALITEAGTEQQRRNRAFAAELLAPASALRTLVRTPIITWEQTEEVAAEFGVSAFIIRHQLENHHIARVQDAEEA